MIEKFSSWIVFEVLGLEAGSSLADALDFFIYDSIKIILLLFGMIFVMGVLRSYISKEKIKNLLSGKVPVLPNVFASLFGAATPFCSCSSVPIFLSFLEAGVPIGTSFSFLVTSPLVNEYVAILMLGIFGWEIALTYVVVGILLGVISGIVIGKLRLEKHLVKDVASRDNTKEKKYENFRQRLEFGYSEAKDITTKMWLWVILGVGVGAIIHGFIPEDAINSVIEAGGVFAVPLAVIIGVPIYANCNAVIPIASALFQKGVPLGTSLAFMMSTAALSLPEAIILRRAMRLPLLALFFGMVALGIILIGYLFNFIF